MVLFECYDGAKPLRRLRGKHNSVYISSCHNLQKSRNNGKFLEISSGLRYSNNALGRSGGSDNATFIMLLFRSSLSCLLRKEEQWIDGWEAACLFIFNFKKTIFLCLSILLFFGRPFVRRVDGKALPRGAARLAGVHSSSGADGARCAAVGGAVSGMDAVGVIDTMRRGAGAGADGVARICAGICAQRPDTRRLAAVSAAGAAGVAFLCGGMPSQFGLPDA